MRKSFLLFVAAFLLNLSVYADKQYEVNGLLYSITSDNSVEVCGITESANTDVIIPSSVNIEDVSYFVTSIGKEALSFSDIQSVSIPNSVVIIESGAFFYCQHLHYIKLEDCESAITINPLGTYSHTDIDSLYIGRDVISTDSHTAALQCGNIKYVRFGKYVKTITPCFPPYQLQEVILDEGVVEIGDKVFSSCNNLKNIKLPLTLMRIGDGAFQSSGLTEILIPDNVKYIGNKAFYQNSFLKKVTLSNCIETIGDKSFYECQQIESITLPGSLEYLGEEAFYNCRRLKDVFIMGKITQIKKNTFYHCDSLKTLVLPSCIEEIGASSFAHCSNLREFVFPDSVKIINSNSLSYCDNIRKIVYNDNVEEIDAIGYEPYYSNKCCLDTIIVNFNRPLPLKKTFRKNIIVIVPHGCGSDFRNADYWKSNIIQEVDEDYVSVNLEQPGTLYTEISKSVSPAKVGKLKITGELGENDWKILKSDKTPMLYSLDLSGISNTEIPKSQFSGKTWLTDIVLPDSIEKINNNSFYGCTRLTGTLNLPESFKTFGEYSMYGTNYDSIVFTNDVSVMSHAFDNCTSLKHISSEYISSIGSQAFSGCKSLERFSTSDKLKTISAFAFNNCSGLSEIVLNEGLEVINENVFQNCSSLKEIAFPFSLKSIAYQVFSGCINMTDFYAPWNSPIRFVFCSYGDEIDLEKATLHVPAGTEGSYAVADGWWHFKNIVSYDPTNVPVYYDDNKRTNTYYDIYGRILNSGSTDQIYIHNGHKYIEMKVF